MSIISIIIIIIMRASQAAWLWGLYPVAMESHTDTVVRVETQPPGAGHCMCRAFISTAAQTALWKYLKKQDWLIVASRSIKLFMSVNVAAVFAQSTVSLQWVYSVILRLHEHKLSTTVLQYCTVHVDGLLRAMAAASILMFRIFLFWKSKPNIELTLLYSSLSLS